MEIVIDIPIEQYNLIMQSHRRGVASFIDKEAMMYAIKNGTPLPKGHGRLIETNTIQSMAREKAEDCFPEGRYDYGYRKALFEFAKDIDEAPPIIEADKGE